VEFLERTFELSGPEGLGSRPRPELVGPVLTHLHETLRDAVRMGFLHSSRARGRIPDSLKAAATARFVRHTANGDNVTVLVFDVPTFGSAAAELFSQKLFWDDGPQPEQTAFELLGAALHDVRRRAKDSNRYDRGLLQRVSGYRRILHLGIDRIRLSDSILEQPEEIDLTVVEAAAELSAGTPPPRRVRVTGRLDLMAASQSILKLVVNEREFVTAIWDGPEPIEDLRESFNRDVVVEGTGVFRPSGALLRIDADAIAPASAQDEFFRRMPGALSGADHQVLSQRRSGGPFPYEQIRDAMPAEESDEEFAAAIEAFS
jgi:hypothetical protein